MNKISISGQKFLYRYRVLVFLFFLTFICQLDRVAISLVGVRIKSAFHLSTEQFGWVISAFALAYTIFEIPSGVLGDRIGQRSLFIRIVLWWSLFTALTGLTTGLMSLLIVRFLFGAGEAGCWPNGTATISRWMPAREIARGYSSLPIGASIGGSVAPFIVVPIAAAFGWQIPFFVIALFGVVWAFICFSWFRNNPSEMKNISREEKEYIEHNRKIGTHQQHLSWKAAFKNKNMWVLPLCYSCCMFCWTFYIYWLPLYLQEGRGFSENLMKNIMSVVHVVGAISAILMSFVSDWLVKKRGLKFGRRFIGIASLSMAAMLFLIIAATASDTVAVACLLIAFFFIVSNTIPSFSTCIDIGGCNVGAVTGIMNTAGQSTGFLIGIVVGKSVQATHSYTSSLFVIATVLIGGAMMWLLVDPTKKISADMPVLKLEKAVLV